MAKQPPAVYLFHGSDEYSLSQSVAEIEERFGDPTVAVFSITCFDGKTLSLNELENTVKALPFMTERRLVVVDDPLAAIKGKPQQARFTAILDQAPSTTALVLVVNRDLGSRDGNPKKDHWLLRWAHAAGSRVYQRAFPSPRGTGMGRWIQGKMEQEGGRITPQAAARMGSLVDGDTRMAVQEIRKLLAYTNYQRPIEVDDVELLTAAVGEENIFAFVDALGKLDGRQAVARLHRLLEDRDALPVYGMVVRQFRLLLLARETLNNGGEEEDIVRNLKVHPYVARKISTQARNFSLPSLEAIYRKLFAVDEAIKSGHVQPDIALETFVVEITAQQV
jgi:DNA polymerase-3 subunit delta